MNRNASTSYQIGLCEYLLVANAGEELSEKLRVEKKYFEMKYGTQTAVKTLPYIIIANLFLKERMEAILCKQLQNICNLHNGFGVMLNNFSGFPPDAIFIRIQNPETFDVLIKNLKRLDDLLKSNDCPPPQFISKPHMTFAHRLNDDVYNNAIVEYAQRDFSDVFLLNQLSLLKRDSRYKEWQHVTHFHLPAERSLFN